MDVWGQIYIDAWEGNHAPHVIERDDGLLDHFDDALHYFDAPRSPTERVVLDQLMGPVLDLGCGVGSYAIYLQRWGREVTAVDSSPGAIRVCSERGVADAHLMDVRQPQLPESRFGSIIVMGNTLGIHQEPETLPSLLRSLRRAAVADARLVCSTIDPLLTDNPAHLTYHRRNRERGLPPGLTRIRMRYGDLVDEWARLWLPTSEELDSAMAASGWQLLDRKISGPHRLDTFGLAG